MENKRRFPRLNIAVKTQYTILDKSSSVLKSRTKDISVAGLRIATKELLDKGAYLDVKFFLPKDKFPIEAIAKVAWCRNIKPGLSAAGFEVGLEFIKIAYEAQERISKFMSKSGEFEGPELKCK